MKLFNRFGSRLARVISPPAGARPVFAAVICGVMAAASSLPAASLPAVDIATSPLFLGSEIPGNLILTPSVEWPTIDSLANLGPYDVTRAYTGYFDANKCYGYQYDSDETKRHFYPVSVAGVSHTCAASSSWSGNFMNWTATQTIDPFRLALTGGYRVVDTPTDTWVEKARSDSHASTSIYPNHVLNAGWGEMSLRIHNLGNKMYFTRTDFAGKSDLESPSATVAYNPGAHDLSGKIKVNGVLVDDPTMYEVSVRVQVCNSAFVETDCKQYSQGWKPEGLIQGYSQSIRYSIFGYLNDHSPLRDGAALRANQKYVGPYTYNPGQGAVSNTAAEWDPTTGVLNKNPDASDASQTNTDMGISTIVDSGVINYLNKFGQMTSTSHKEYDATSELYYAAIRYVKHMGNVSAYSSVSGTSAEKYSLADGFPVITTWTDPLALRCQANVILGIGDVNTWNDKNLPGPTSSAVEPAKPAEVVADTTVDVVVAINKVMDLEGLAHPALNSFSGRNNSAYIAGLAYDSHTRDIRPDLLGKQTVSTHWVDVLEAQVQKPEAQNQYWLAAKYGGFRVPDDYGDPYARTAPLTESWWHSTTDVLSTGDLRPDNYYVASQADLMVESLTRAFARIVAETSGSGASFGANSGKLQTGSTIYQARYYSGSWRGELTAYPLDVDTGNILPPSWVAGDNVPAWASRKIYSNSGGTFQAFIWANLSAADRTTLGSSAVVDYLRGDRSNETPAGGLRVRQGVLGDFVDSPPFYVGAPDPATYGTTGFTGASSYAAFVAAQAAVKGVVYLGGNDGMLHGFDSATGVETFAYVPNAALNANLKAYTVPKYAHQYSVDGEVTSASVYISGAWKQILVGTMGRGGRGIFALDVTDPANVKLLWDKTGANIPELGNNLGQPIIAQVADGDWRVILGNGPNSSAGTTPVSPAGAAQLLMVKLSDGSATPVNLGGSVDNGLSAPLVWNANPSTDPFFDTAYAGDLKGNVWKVTGLSTASPVKLKLFTATDAGGKAQPITAAPLGAIRPTSTEMWLFFGTGRYLGNGDLGNTDVQTWYGIKDANALITSRSSLVKRDILAETTGDLTAVPPTFGGRAISAGTASELTSKSGWYLDLVSPGVGGQRGERMVVPNVFQGLALRGTTIIPNAGDPCNTAGQGFDMAIDPFTGGRLSGGFYDINGDGQVSDADMITLADGTKVHASGILLASGANRPTIIGNNSYLTLLNGGQQKNPIPQVTKFKRVSWREIIGD
jgi:type IV pilus assembly protein PilY1